MKRDNYLTYVPKVKWRDEPKVITGDDLDPEHLRVLMRW